MKSTDAARRSPRSVQQAASLVPPFSGARGVPKSSSPRGARSIMNKRPRSVPLLYGTLLFAVGFTCGPILNNLIRLTTLTTDEILMKESERLMTAAGVLPPVSHLHNLSSSSSTTETTWPAPLIPNNTTVVLLVLSARQHHERRRAIRTTWKQPNVFFVVGTSCHIAPTQRSSNYTCESRTEPSFSWWQRSQKRHYQQQLLLEQQDADYYKQEMERQDVQLAFEQAKYRDMILIEAPDTYRGIVQKVQLAYQWALKQFPLVQWIVKVDDDTYARVELLTELLQNYSSQEYSIVGSIVRDDPVNRDGKWAERHYRPPSYPPWPRGACGHAVSRPVAEYISSSQLFHYQGEDTSLGIWMDESPMKHVVAWEDSERFVFSRDCSKPEYVVVGHDFSPSDMKECHEGKNLDLNPEGDWDMNMEFGIDDYNVNANKSQAGSDDDKVIM